MEQRDGIIYQIRIKGHLDQTWIVWLISLTSLNEADGDATLTGAVRDQAELHSLIDKVLNLNLTFLAVNRLMTSSK